MSRASKVDKLKTIAFYHKTMQGASSQIYISQLNLWGLSPIKALNCETVQVSTLSSADMSDLQDILFYIYFIIVLTILHIAPILSVFCRGHKWINQ